jgi:hypothetical protein
LNAFGVDAAAAEAQVVRQREGGLVTEIQYYRRSLAVPVIVPLAAMFVGQFRAGVSAVVGFLAFSLLFGGIPYGILVAAVLRWSRGKPARALRRLSYWMPVLMALAFVGLMLGVSVLLQGFSFDSGTRTDLGVFVAFILVLGYGYVILVNGVAAILRARGAFADPLPNTRLLRTGV